MNILKKINLKNTLVQHLIFWLTVFCFQFATYIEEAINGLVGKWSLPYRLVQLLVLAFASYINLYVFIPKFLKRKKIGLYFFFNLINLLTCSTFLFIFAHFSYTNIKLHEGSWDHHILYSFSILLVLVFIAISTMYYFIVEWYKLKNIQTRLLSIEKEKIATEHNALKAQLNPHFLFNALNNIYSLSLKKSDNTPDTVLKLSDMLSYMLYDCKADKINIKKEIEFIHHYIELEKIRSKKVQVEFNHQIPTNIDIPPLLFLPFVENAFKHSKTNDGNSSILIKIDLNNQNIVNFNCENNKGEKRLMLDKNKSGLGIENIKKRLNLLFPKSHQLTINETDTKYKVDLTLELANL